MTPEQRERFKATIQSPEDTFYIAGEETVYRTGDNQHFPVCAVHVHYDGLIDGIIVYEDMSADSFDLTRDDPLYILAMETLKA